MMATRRGFLTGLAAAFAAPAIAHAANLMPVRSFAPELIGDGIADDTEALHAVISRKPFWHRGLLVRTRANEPVRVPSGTFRLKSSLVLEAGVHDVSMCNSMIYHEGDGPMIICGEARNVQFTNIHFRYGKPSDWNERVWLTHNHVDIAA